MMERVCFLGRVPAGPAGRVPRTARRGVAGDARCARRAGWSNYSLFLAEDGLLVGYLETDNHTAALDRMADTPVSSRWQAEMAGFFTELDGLPPDQGFRRVAEVFHLG